MRTFFPKRGEFLFGDTELITLSLNPIVEGWNFGYRGSRIIHVLISQGRAG